MKQSMLTSFWQPSCFWTIQNPTSKLFKWVQFLSVRFLSPHCIFKLNSDVNSNFFFQFQLSPSRLSAYRLFQCLLPLKRRFVNLKRSAARFCNFQQFGLLFKPFSDEYFALESLKFGSFNKIVNKSVKLSFRALMQIFLTFGRPVMLVLRYF